MSLTFSRNAFFATKALLLTSLMIWAGPADDLIKKGDDLDLNYEPLRRSILFGSGKAGAQERKSTFGHRTAGL
jgi:hypothetical protein